MNSQITRFKHIANYNLLKAQDLFQKNWFKLVLVFLVAFVITRKDLSISLNLNSAASYISETTESVPTAHAEQTSYITNEVPPDDDNKPLDMKSTAVSPAAKKKTKDNKANDFSNIGFVLNPGYAKRHNIDPAIVAEKKKIVDAYIKRYAKTAQQEMEEYGIPASITLAQGLLESDAGKSRLALQNNNHFGIKCFSRNCAKGHCSNYTDDTHKDFFRKYDSAWESFRAHSTFLQKDRYKHLKKYGTTDYESWAHGLRKAGYATDKRYAYKLIGLIEALDLDKYDR